MKYCATCNHITHDDSQWSCPHCHKQLETGSAEAIQHALQVKQTQLMATQTAVVNALSAHKGNELAQEVWATLDKSKKEALATTLNSHGITLVLDGHFDDVIVKYMRRILGDSDEVKTVVLSDEFQEAFQERATKLLCNDDWKRFDAAIHIREIVDEYTLKATKQCAEQLLSASHETLVMMVRDKLPDMEKLAEDIVRSIIEEATHDVKRKVTSR